jgi:hypothetical protein
MTKRRLVDNSEWLREWTKYAITFIRTQRAALIAELGLSTVAHACRKMRDREGRRLVLGDILDCDGPCRSRRCGYALLAMNGMIWVLSELGDSRACWPSNQVRFRARLIGRERRPRKVGRDK